MLRVEVEKTQFIDIDLDQFIEKHKESYLNFLKEEYINDELLNKKEFLQRLLYDDPHYAGEIFPDEEFVIEKYDETWATVV